MNKSDLNDTLQINSVEQYVRALPRHYYLLQALRQHRRGVHVLQTHVQLHFVLLHQRLLFQIVEVFLRLSLNLHFDWLVTAAFAMINHYLFLGWRVGVENKRLA